jgi:hypothetical protein
MADKPILFGPTVVASLLAGNKTQHRWALEPQPVWDSGELGFADGLLRSSFKTPYEVGDRLWVQETWNTNKQLSDLSGEDIERLCFEFGYKRAWAPITYSDGERINWKKAHRALVNDRSKRYATGSKTRKPYGDFRKGSSMPRWASRLTLIVEDVCVQRLQDISEADAAAQGLNCWHDGWKVYGGELPNGVLADVTTSPVNSFASLWRSINGAGSWDANPWVAAYTFRVIRANIDQVQNG